MLNNIVDNTEQCRQLMLFSTAMNMLCDFGCVTKRVSAKIYRHCVSCIVMTEDCKLKLINKKIKISQAEPEILIFTP